MNNHDHSKYARFAVAFCALAALGGRAAQAQAISDPFKFTGPGADASQLGPGAFTIDNPTGDTNGFVDSPFTVSGNGVKVTYTALNGTPGAPSFEASDNSSGAFDFPNPTNLIDTNDGSTTDGGITGGLRIDFSQPVNAFGLKIQDAVFDEETFTVTATDQNGNNFAFASPTVDQTDADKNPSGISVFLGAQGTGGDFIKSVTITSASTLSGQPTVSSNDFYFSPITLRSNAPVPEASTFVGSGIGLILFAGMLWSASKRKASRGSQSAPQTTG